MKDKPDQRYHVKVSKAGRRNMKKKTKKRLALHRKDGWDIPGGDSRKSEREWRK